MGESAVDCCSVVDCCSMGAAVTIAVAAVSLTAGSVSEMIKYGSHKSVEQ